MSKQIKVINTLLRFRYCFKHELFYMLSIYFVIREAFFYLFNAADKSIHKLLPSMRNLERKKKD